MNRLWQEQSRKQLEHMAQRKQRGRIQASVETLLDNHSHMDRQIKGLMFSYQIEERFVRVIRDKLDNNQEVLDNMLSWVATDDTLYNEDRHSFTDQEQPVLLRKKSSSHNCNQVSVEHGKVRRSYFHDISPLRQDS